MWRTAKWTKRTCVGALRSKRGSCSSGEVWRTIKRDSTGYCSSPTSTYSSLHGLLFINHRPPPASTSDCSSMDSCSSSLHRSSTGYCSASPLTGSCSTTPPRATVHPALHRLLFNQPSTGSSCSSSPPQGRPVHPALHGVLFIQPQPARSIGVIFIQRQPWGHVHPLPPGTVHPSPPATLTVHPNPPATLTVHPEAASISFS